MTRWIFDTGVWLHLAGSKAVRDAVAAVRARPHEVLTTPVSLAEIVSVLHRRGHGDRVGPVLRSLRQASTIATMDPETYEEGGRLHAAERAHHPDVSLCDGLILATAKAADAMILTTDRALATNHQAVRARHVLVETTKNRKA